MFRNVCEPSSQTETVYGLALIRLNLASAGAYKHLAAFTSSVTQERCCVRAAAERWRQWSELRNLNPGGDHVSAEVAIAEEAQQEYTHILGRGDWTVSAVIEGDTLLVDYYHQAITALQDSAICSILERHVRQIETQMHLLQNLQTEMLSPETSPYQYA